MPREWLIQHRAGTLAEWAAAEASGPALLAGERAYITDLKLDVVGDGVTKVASLGAVGSGTYVPAGATATLPRWRRVLQTSPATAVISIVGDSTSDEGTAAASMYARLRGLHTRLGEALYGMTSDMFTDGACTSGSKTFTSASAAFTASDVGRVLLAAPGAGVTLGTTIASIDSATQVQLSANATVTTTGATFSVGRHVVNRGNNGMSLHAWLADSTKLAALVADAPNLVIASWLINDVRLGGCDLATAKTRLRSFIEAVQAALPNADIVLRIPNPMLTANVSSLNFVQTAGGTINPAGLAQTYSDLIRQAYLSLDGAYPNVEIVDIPAEVFGAVCRSSHPLMTDQLHPTISGSWLGTNPTGSGYTEIADCLARKIGVTRGTWVNNTQSYRFARPFRVVGGLPASVQIAAVDEQAAPAAQSPITTSDLLFVEGFDGPISLSGKSIFRPYGGTNILVTGLTGLDFTAAAGRMAMVVGSHADATTQDRQIVSVDLPSVAAGAIDTATVAVTGVRTADSSAAAGIVAVPPNAFTVAGLVMLNAYPANTDSVTVVVYNPTGAAIDRAAENWTFWVVR